MASEGRMTSRAREDLRPAGQVRLGPLRLPDEARDRGGEDPAPPHVVAVGEARIEPRAVRVARARDVDETPRPHARDADATLAGDHDAALRPECRDDDLRMTQEALGGRHT